MRNRAVTTMLQQQYRSMTRDPRPLPVFVVGNEAYKKHQAGYSNDDKPALTVQQTNIPALRQRIYSIPAEGKLNEALHLSNVQLPSIVNSFELYCARSHLARKAEIEAILAKPKTSLRNVLNATFERLEADTQPLLISPMAIDEARWDSAARRLCQSWGTLYRANHLQMLKANGFKKGNEKRGVPAVSWNAELIRLNRESVDDYFTNLLGTLIATFEDLKKRLRSVTDDVRVKIRSKSTLHLLCIALLTQQQVTGSSTSWFWSHS